ncbi:MAG TPA: FtsX-like permease family protein [Dissulfurispiraceae bacterium]|nr:FtsX-like permease family protein [Dissulfurispiraceae bacterium]
MNRINKHRNILDFTLSSLLRRKRKNTALVLVYILVVFGLASVLFSTQALKREACSILQRSPEVVIQRLVAGRHELIPTSYIDKIKDVRGVQTVKRRLWGYYYDPTVGANYTLMVPDDPAVAEGTIVIGKGVARTLRAEKGDLLPFKANDGFFVSLEVGDIISSDSELVSSDLVLMNEGDFRQITGVPAGYFTDMVLSVRNVKELPTIAEKIRRLAPDTRPIVKDDILRTYETIFDWRGGILLVILAGAIMAFIIFAWDKASGLSSEERKEIGILKGIGWETSDVILMKFWEGTVISLSSFLLGCVFAYIHIFYASSALFEPVLKGWAVLYPKFRLIPYIDPLQLATLFFLTVIPYTVATIIPSWRAATVDPDSVMRL